MEELKNKIDKQGELISSNGDKIDKQGELISSNGDKIDKQGDILEKQGDILEKQGIKLIEHDMNIKQIAMSISEVNTVQKESNSKLDDIVHSMSKQEVILDKLSNLESNSKESFNRVHKRIDVVEGHISKIEITGDTTGCTSLQVLKQQVKIDTQALDDRTKSGQHRIEKIENTITWVTRIIVGTVLLGLLSLLFVIKH